MQRRREYNDSAATVRAIFRNGALARITSMMRESHKGAKDAADTPGGDIVRKGGTPHLCESVVSCNHTATRI